MPQFRIYFAEFLATFMLIFCGTGAIIINQETQGTVSHLGIAITFGLIVMAMVYAFGPISGAHMNPAVSLVMVFLGRLPASKLLFYVAAQFLGAVLASLILKMLFPSNIGLGGTMPAGSDWQSVVLEFILTFILVLVVLLTAFGPAETVAWAGFCIGMVVLMEALFAGPICGASMNPVRSLAPALVSGQWASQWVYVVAPIMGALAAAGVWRTFFEEKREGY